MVSRKLSFPSTQQRRYLEPLVAYELLISILTNYISSAQIQLYYANFPLIIFMINKTIRPPEELLMYPITHPSIRN